MTVGLFAVDLLIKRWSFANVAPRPVELRRGIDDHHAFWSQYPHEAIDLVPWVLSLKLTTNTGAVFGLGKGSQPLFIIMSLVAVGVIGYFFYHGDRRAWPRHVGLALILGGALGNLYDRVMFNAVRDMFWLLPGVKLPFGLRWPGGMDDAYPWLFNLADVALLAGVGMMVVILWFEDTRRQAAGKAQG